ncbi:hypothetical protein M2352_004355 [Azospirillum fermentarium]|uniref:hypothetical protein n=1 Tax=Azospirillum fermentarium TaxID=1233114 RepID=UPI002226C0C2|nr:hypothetical protein [Azospirillum fermentarium]MCW2248695.1 hypothetical protein [Azospirillum fermentarium]
MATTFPAAVVANGQIVKIAHGPESFIYGDFQHPAAAWEFWEPDDWLTHCPDWTVLPVHDEPPPDDPAKVVTRLPETSWVITPDGVRVLYSAADTPAADMAAALAGLRAAAVERVNREAGEARARHITVAVGQGGTYLEKAREARAYLSDTAPDPIHYPYLSAEAEHTSQTMDTVARSVAAAADAWTPVNARIEGLRQGALASIRGAGSPVAVAAVFPIDWPIPA